MPTSPQDTQPKRKTATDLVQVRVSSSSYRVGPGDEFVLVFEFNIEPDWHMYWKNPGESGAPTLFDFEAPNGYEIGPAVFSRPQRMVEPVGVTYGYEHHAVVAFPVKAPANIDDGSFEFQTTITFLVCRGVCMMGQFETTTEINTVGAPTGSKASLEPIAKSLDVTFPKPLKELEQSSATFDGKKLTIVVPAAEKQDVAFYPVEMPGVTYAKSRVDRRDGIVHIIVPVELNPGNALGKPMRVAGLVALGNTRSDPCFEFDLSADVSNAQPAG